MPTTFYSEDEYEDMNERYKSSSSVLSLIYKSFENDHRERSYDSICYTFIPIRFEAIIDDLIFLRRYFKKHHLNYRYYDFLDVGCGIGNNVLLAKAVFRNDIEVYGIERDKKLCELAKQFLGKENHIFNADAFDFKNYNKFGIIYYFCPMKDPKLEVKLESLIEKNMKIGSFLVPFLKRHREKDYDVGELVFNGEFEQLDKSHNIFKKIS